jgi:uncharacterized protein (DUF58 family)
MQRVKDVLKKVKKLDISTHNLVEGIISGSYKSVFKGRGYEFSEVREYAMGDDVRDIDWNVTARSNEPHVKKYIEERDLDLYVVFDKSASLDYGSDRSKKDLGYEVAASVMNAALKNNDNVGLILFSDKVDKVLKAKKGRKHFFKMLRDLVLFEPDKKKTDLNFVLKYLNKILKKRSVIVVFSDLISDNFEKPLRILKKKHNVVIINLYDLNEKILPNVGYIYLEDEETGEQVLVDSSDESFRNYFLTEVKEENESLKKMFNKINVDVVNINTKESFYLPMKQFFENRKKRLVR